MVARNLGRIDIEDTALLESEIQIGDALANQNSVTVAGVIKQPIPTAVGDIVSEKDEQRATLEQASTNDLPIGEGGIRQYNDAFIDSILAESFSEDTRNAIIRATERQILKFGFRKENENAQKRIDTENFTTPRFDNITKQSVPADFNAVSDLQETILTEDEIQEKVDELVPADPAQPAGAEEETTTENTEGSGESLGADASYPQQEILNKAHEGPANELPSDLLGKELFTVTWTPREPPVIPAAVLAEFIPQIDPSARTPEGEFKFKPPPLVPLAAVGQGGLFMEPISRQVFTLIFTSPVGFFWVGIHIPCMFPIILPPIYPVSNLGPPPAGGFALAFIDPTLPYCGGSAPLDANVFFNGMTPTPNVEALTQGVERCDYNLPAEELARCVREQQAKMAEAYQGLPVPPQLQELLDLVKELTKETTPLPDITTPEPEPPQGQERIEIVVTDPPDVFDFKIDIIE